MHSFGKCLLWDMPSNFPEIISYLTETENKQSWHVFTEKRFTWNNIA